MTCCFWTFVSQALVCSTSPLDSMEWFQTSDVHRPWSWSRRWSASTVQHTCSVHCAFDVQARFIAHRLSGIFNILWPCFPYFKSDRRLQTKTNSSNLSFSLIPGIQNSVFLISRKKEGALLFFLKLLSLYRNPLTLPFGIDYCLRAFSNAFQCPEAWPYLSSANCVLSTKTRLRYVSPWYMQVLTVKSSLQPGELFKLARFN